LKKVSKVQPVDLIDKDDKVLIKIKEKSNGEILEKPIEVNVINGIVFNNSREEI
jgi:hypothetical protein